MGASDFWTKGTGKTASEAFSNAVKQAQYEHGHAGYTGTIAEKHGYVMLTVPVGKDPVEHARWACENDERYEEKWGPALCVKTGENQYLFFGIASS